MLNQQYSRAFDALNPSEIAKAAAIFDNLKQLRIKLKNGDEAVLERAFEDHVQKLLENLEVRLQQFMDPQQQVVEVILARHGLYDAAFQQVMMLSQAISPALGDSVKDLRSVHSGLFSDFQQVFRHVLDENARLAEALQGSEMRIAELEDNCMKLDQTLRHLNEEAEDQNKKIVDLRQHLRSTTQELNKLREGYGANTTVSVIPKRPAFDNTTTLTRSKSPNPMIFSEIASPNRTMKRSGSANSLSASISLASRRSLVLDDLRSENGGGGGNRSTAALNTPTRGPLVLIAPVHWLQAFREDVQRALDDKRCRHMTINECKEAIERIYESKAIANDKAIQNIGNIPMETMEQHVYRNYEKKYGLRSLSVEHAGSLLRAAEEYSAEDNDVNVFLKIFRNEIEEDFRLVQKELVSSIRDLAMVQLMGKYPSKDSVTINNFLEQKLSSGTIYEDEWRDMVNYLYNASDSATLCLLLKRQAQMLRDRDNEIPSLSATVSFNNTNPGALTSSGSFGGPQAAASSFMMTTSILPQKITGPTKSNSMRSMNSSGRGFDDDSNMPPSPMKTNSFVLGVPNVAKHSTDNGSGVIGFDRGRVKDVKRLGYASPTLKINVKEQPTTVRSKRDMLFLPFPMFVKVVQEFQLKSHQEYLAPCLRLFRQLDQDVDGVLNGAEFKDFLHALRRFPGSSGAFESEEDELRELLSVMKIIDPYETDRIIFSAAVMCLQRVQQGGSGNQTSS